MGEISCEFRMSHRVIGVMYLRACVRCAYVRACACMYEGTCVWAISCCHYCCYRFCSRFATSTVCCHSRWMDGYLSDWSDCCLMLCHTHFEFPLFQCVCLCNKNINSSKKEHLAIINSHKFTLSHSILRRIFLSVNIINGQFHHKMGGWIDGCGKVRAGEQVSERNHFPSIFPYMLFHAFHLRCFFISWYIAHSAR